MTAVVLRATSHAVSAQPAAAVVAHRAGKDYSFFRVAALQSVQAVTSDQMASVRVVQKFAQTAQ